MATYQTYEARGLREDLSDVIYSISPTDTPFMSSNSEMNISSQCSVRGRWSSPINPKNENSPRRARAARFNGRAIPLPSRGSWINSGTERFLYSSRLGSSSSTTTTSVHLAFVSSKACMSSWMFCGLLLDGTMIAKSLMTEFTSNRKICSAVNVGIKVIWCLNQPCCLHHRHAQRSLFWGDFFF